MSNIEKLCSVLNISAEEAKFLLESTNGDIQRAIEIYSSEGQQVEEKGPTLSRGMGEFKKESNSKKSGMFSFKDLQSGDDDGNEGKQGYYAGGSSRSGQQILGPNDGKDVNNLARKLFERAMKHAEEPKAPTLPEGRRLGSMNTDQPSKPQTTTQPEEEKTITFTFYDDGFTIDDGPLRSLEDPENKKLLEDMNNGFVPVSLSKGAKNVNVKLDKKPGKYTPPPKQFTAFTSQGRSLSSESSNTSQKPIINSSSRKKYQFDPSKPKTMIQLRLPNGPVRQEFNLENTVQDIVDFIYVNQSFQQNFELVTSFPRKVLTDLSATIKEANLQNSALIVQPSQ